jgi:drug/metabolite transporter (DMT)-like permease
MTPLPTYHDNRRGIIALTSACALFTVNDTLTKLATLAYPTGEVLLVRGIISLICLGAVVAYSHQFSWLRHATNPYVLLRAALDTGANITFVLALSRMRLADLLAVNLVSPLLLTLLLVVFFGERIGWRRWTAILVGFAGTLLIVKPSTESLNVWALVALVAAAFSATRDVITRKIDPAISTLAISFFSVLAVTLTAPLLALGFAEQWHVPNVEYSIFIAAAAIILSIGSTMAVAAFRHVDISVVAPFRYSLLIWGGLSGYFIFGEVSDVHSLCGSALIVGSGLYSLHRERVRHRELSAKSGIH